MKSLDSETIIIGGGITGLMCAASLERAGREYLLLESRGRLGGRIQTHEHHGFLLDAGFQTYLTSYDQGEPFLQPSALKLRNFDPGAYIADGRRLSYLGDPMRNLSCLLETLKCPAAGLKDRWLIWKLSQRLLRTPDCDIWNHREVSSFEYLQDLGFSDTFIDQFLRPFFGGVFLDNELSVSSRLFEFLFKRFTMGFASLPEVGMEAIPVALGEHLNPHRLLLNTFVTSLEGNLVRTADGRNFRGKNIVCALEEHAASKCLNLPTPETSFSTTVFYYSTRNAPLRHPSILLNSTGKGKIQHLCYPSQIQPSYSPDGFHLVSVTVLGNQAEASLDGDHPLVCAEAQGLLNSETSDWEFLKSFQIPRALPKMKSMPGPGFLQMKENLWLAGDYLSYPSINGAFHSGKSVAQQLDFHASC